MIQYKTAESVCQGHPDKLCDYIADSILDACLYVDPSARVACEVMATKGHIFVAGEITCKKRINIRDVVRRALKGCGYNPWKFLVYVYVHRQSEDIANGVDTSLEARNGDVTSYSALGAGDQGTVYGYATDETPALIPAPLYYAHKICERLDFLRREGSIQGIYSDGKSQVTLEYEERKPSRVEAIVVSIQHSKDKDIDVLKKEIRSEVLEPIFSDLKLDENTKVYVNPAGSFTNGGPAADTGLTGRKIMVDTYGGLSAHGGGAFSGKDPSKVDRSGAYMARYMAKRIVASGLAKEVEVAFSYAIGKADPVMVSVKSFGTSQYSDEVLTRLVTGEFELRPGAIIETLRLKKVRYRDTSCYGHFSSSLFPWENTFFSHLLVEEVKNYVD